MNICGVVELTGSIILKNYVNICGLRAFTLGGAVKALNICGRSRMLQYIFVVVFYYFS